MFPLSTYMIEVPKRKILVIGGKLDPNCHIDVVMRSDHFETFKPQLRFQLTSRGGGGPEFLPLGEVESKVITGRLDFYSEVLRQLPGDLRITEPPEETREPESHQHWNIMAEICFIRKLSQIRFILAQKSPAMLKEHMVSFSNSTYKLGDQFTGETSLPWTIGRFFILHRK